MKTKNTASKFTAAYKAHLADIDKAQSAFDKEMNTTTATKLSNLKNNMFKKPEEVFTQEYINRKLKEAMEVEQDDMIEWELKIKYAPGLYNHRAQSLMVIEKTKEKSKATAWKGTTK